jgi:hypothetical protein
LPRLRVASVACRGGTRNEGARPREREENRFNGNLRSGAAVSVACVGAKLIASGPRLTRPVVTDVIMAHARLS